MPYDALKDRLKKYRAFETKIVTTGEKFHKNAMLLPGLVRR